MRSGVREKRPDSRTGDGFPSHRRSPSPCSWSGNHPFERSAPRDQSTPPGPARFVQRRGGAGLSRVRGGCPGKISRPVPGSPTRRVSITLFHSPEKGGRVYRTPGTPRVMGVNSENEGAGQRVGRDLNEREDTHFAQMRARLASPRGGGIMRTMCPSANGRNPVPRCRPSCAASYRWYHGGRASGS